MVRCRLIWTGSSGEAYPIQAGESRQLRDPPPCMRALTFLQVQSDAALPAVDATI